MADPLPLCYLNGEYLPLPEARISPLDRGFLYGDGVYEVMPVYGGRPFRFDAHLERLQRSLAGIRMEDPHTRAEWRTLLGTLIERNGGGDQYVYWQVTPRRRARPHARTAAAHPAHRVRLLRAPAAAAERAPRGRHRLRHRRGHALGALRHQVHGPARERAAAAAVGRRRCRRDHPAARRGAHGGLGVRGARGARRGGTGAAQLAPHSARHDALGRAGDGRARRHPLARGAGQRDAAARGGGGVDLGRDPRSAAGNPHRRQSGRQRGAPGRCGGASTRSCSATSASSPGRPGERARGAAARFPPTTP